MTTYRWSFFEDVIGVDRAGFRRLAVWRRKLDDFGIDRAVELLHDHRIQVSSLNWAGGFTGSSGFTFAEAVEDVRDAIRDAAALGARTLSIVSGPRGGHISTHARRILMEGLSATVDVAAEHGVVLALQPMAKLYAHEWTFLNSLDATLEVLSELNHPFLGMAFGSYHLWQEPDLSERILEAAPYVATVQLSDWMPPLHDTDRFLPGDGIVPLPEIVVALLQAGYRGDFEIDVWSSNLWKSDYDSLLATARSRCLALVGADHAVEADRPGVSNLSG